jgi:uncharacterized protein DUF3300
MKRTFAALLALTLALSLRAQTPGDTYSPDQLDQLLAPIALYPDPLIALILPASTFPNDIASAAQYVAANPDPAGIDSQPWDASVKGLAHYPDVLKWMNDNIDWTHTLGAAFAMQPSDVMKSVQQLRAKAKAAGTLTDTPQQQVDMEGDDIRIIPAQPDTIYVPEYDPDVVYDVPEGDVGPYISFGVGFPVGVWLGYQCNWDDFGIWVGPWQRGWAYRRDWNGYGGRWHPDPRAGHALVRNYFRPGGSLPAPRLIAGAHGPVLRGSAPAFSRGAAPMARPTLEQSHADYRGYGNGAVARPSTPAPRGSLFGGYDRGTRARDFSNRGQKSRQAPVRSAPARSAPERSSSPGRSSAPEGGRDRH